MSDELRIILTLINLAYTDYNLCEKEMNWILEFSKKYDFSDEEINQIEKELSSPREDCLYYFDSISSYFCKGKVLELARYLFHIDKKYSPGEKKEYLLLKKSYDERYFDLKNIQNEVAQSIVEDEEELHFYRSLKTSGEELKSIMRYRALPSSLGFFNYQVLLIDHYVSNLYINKSNRKKAFFLTLILLMGWICYILI